MSPNTPYACDLPRHAERGPNRKGKVDGEKAFRWLSPVRAERVIRPTRTDGRGLQSKCCRRTSRSYKETSNRNPCRQREDEIARPGRRLVSVEIGTEWESTLTTCIPFYF
jgi:hypothetical protein